MIKGNRESKAALFILPMLTREDIISHRSMVSLTLGKVLLRRDNRLSPDHMSLDQLHAGRILYCFNGRLKRYQVTWMQCERAIAFHTAAT
jgi:hypothetical protein